ncbi:hypothetical protein BCM02_11745 [Paenibacillus methanolicus]|uniref:Secreted protein n=1 Tax=Paenibacillus methanolicus TaxID=582686 RepID=A0A5S5BPK9_9BACL|nr:hypothetical protein BCM02_11745 [Paenibacillus methanolicus]
MGIRRNVSPLRFILSSCFAASAAIMKVERDPGPGKALALAEEPAFGRDSMKAHAFTLLPIPRMLPHASFVGARAGIPGRSNRRSHS